MLNEWLLYGIVGAIAGFLAGMLGIGGGLILVPTLIFIFSSLGFSSEIITQLALGSALATIAFTAGSAVYTHHKAKMIDWPIVLKLAPALALGAYLGSLLIYLFSKLYWNYLFGSFCIFMSLKMMVHWKPHPGRQLPTWPWLSAAGVLIGSISSLLGIGGGTLIVPFLSWRQVPIKRAIGASSACGLLISIGGSFGYLSTGWGTPNLPQFSLGFIYIPALTGIVATSIFFAHLGAKATHSLPVIQIKRVFSILLALIGAKFLFFW